MAIISVITVSVLCFAAISRGSLTNEILLESPHEVTLKEEKVANELGFELNRHHILTITILNKLFILNYTKIIYLIKIRCNHTRLL